MRGGHKHLLHKVLVAGCHTRHPTAAALLLAIGVQVQPLDVAGVGNGNNHILLGNQIFLIQRRALLAHNRGAAFVAEFIFNLHQLLLDNAQHHPLAGKHLLQISNSFNQLGIFRVNFAVLQTGQRPQTHFQNGRRLLVGEAEAFHQFGARLVRVGGVANGCHNLVDIIQGYF